MLASKIEPRLVEHLRTAADAPIPVLVQLPIAALGESTTLAVLEAARAGPKAQIVAALSRLGYGGEVNENLLAGTLELALRPEQILALAAEETVWRILWNRLDEGIAL